MGWEGAGRSDDAGGIWTVVDEGAAGAGVAAPLDGSVVVAGMATTSVTNSTHQRNHVE